MSQIMKLSNIRKYDDDDAHVIGFTPEYVKKVKKLLLNKINKIIMSLDANDNDVIVFNRKLYGISALIERFHCLYNGLNDSWENYKKMELVLNTDVQTL